MFATPSKKTPLADTSQPIKRTNPLQKLSENLHKLSSGEIPSIPVYKAAQRLPLIQSGMDDCRFVDINKHLEGDKENCLQDLINQYNTDPALQGTLAHKSLLRLQAEKEAILKKAEQKPLTPEMETKQQSDRLEQSKRSMFERQKAQQETVSLEELFSAVKTSQDVYKKTMQRLREELNTALESINIVPEKKESKAAQSTPFLEFAKQRQIAAEKTLNAIDLYLKNGGDFNERLIGSSDLTLVETREKLLTFRLGITPILDLGTTLNYGLSRGLFPEKRATHKERYVNPVREKGYKKIPR